MRGWLTAIGSFLDVNERRQRQQEHLVASIKEQALYVTEIDLLPAVLEGLRLQSAGIEMNPDVEWLKRHADAEDGCDVGVGGYLCTRIEELEQDQQQSRELLVQFVRASLRLPIIPADLRLLTNTCQDQPWYDELFQAIWQREQVVA
jgi:hypothetical protein